MSRPALPLADWFAWLRAAGRAAFLPYVTTGYPSPAAMPGVLAMLRDAGVDGLEIGVPFSDPIADGPTIQRSSHMALARGATLDDALRAAERASRLGLRVALMSYANPLLQGGLPAVARRAARAGVQGAIVPDVPVEESGPWSEAFADAGIALAQFAAPTTTPARLRLIDRRARGFLYYVSLTGVTGERRALPPGLKTRLLALRRIMRTPVAVGFGISTPDQARAVAELAEGVIVGAGLVRRLGSWTEGPAARRATARWVRAMAAAVHSAEKRGRS